jgi:ectoine hydroxylase-related dioxygenase (phytanoyl-CoA dioxygenase family)
MKNTNIFNNEFVNTESHKILQALKEDGIFFFKNALNEIFINELLTEINNNKFSINTNWSSGVYTEKQYYVKHLLSCSKSFYNLSTSPGLTNICDNFFENNYRLKSYRYYETFFNHKMEWHTDNKLAKKAGNEFKEIPGIIFIIYLNDVQDGEFQFIKGSHKISNVEAYNVYSDNQILNEFQKDLVSYKGKKGDLIIYNTYGIHRAKPVSKNKNFVRKSLFLQIDENLSSAEPSLINPSYFDKLDNKTLKYFGFGLPTESRTYPDTNIKRLPMKIFLKEIFFPYILYKIPIIIYMLFPTIIRKFIKKILR